MRTECIDVARIKIEDCKNGSSNLLMTTASGEWYDVTMSWSDADLYKYYKGINNHLEVVMIFDRNDYIEADLYIGFDTGHIRRVKDDKHDVSYTFSGNSGDLFKVIENRCKELCEKYEGNKKVKADPETDAIDNCIDLLSKNPAACFLLGSLYTTTDKDERLSKIQEIREMLGI